MRTAAIGIAMLLTLLLTVNVRAEQQQPLAQPGVAQAENGTPPGRASLFGSDDEGDLPPMPGPDPRSSAEFLVREGNALLEAGYIDAAQENYQRALNVAPDNDPVMDRAWYGLARVHMSRHDVELAKTAVEEILSRNLDPTSVARGRDLYTALRAEAQVAYVEAQRALDFYNWRYHSIPGLNIISKIFAYMDLRKSRERFNQAAEVLDSFNPRYLIGPVSGSPHGSETVTMSQTQLASLLDQIPTSSSDTYTVVEGVHSPSPEDTPVAPIIPTASEQTGSASETAGGAASATEVATQTPEGAAASSTGAASERDELQSSRDSYLDAYRKLQDALRSGNQGSIAQASQAFQEANRRYSNARRSLTQ